jgi:GT2 family glycosyltransferase
LEKLLISIVTWNSEQTIASCIRSVLNQTFSDFLLLIVDNNSKDKTCDIVQSFNDERIQFFKKSENTGFCGGHNFSINQSKSDFVLLVNPDIIMKENYVDKALKMIECDAKIGTVCGLLLQTDESDTNCKIDSSGLRLLNSRVMRMNHHGDVLNEVSLKSEEVFGADGALPLYRREMINDISYKGQFFDELFFAHKEDWDVSWRSNIYGWKTIFSPDCVAIHPRHFKPGSLKVRTDVADHIKFHSVKNQLLLLLKNESVGSFIKNSVFIIPRQLIIFVYILLFERSSFKAYHFIYANLQTIMERRKIIQSKRAKV